MLLLEYSFLGTLPTSGHMRSNNYSTTKIFVNNFLMFTLSIMLTNHFSPYDVLAMFLDLDRVRTLAVYERVRELSDFIQHVLRVWNYKGE